jgi:hypothetical protein
MINLSNIIIESQVHSALIRKIIKTIFPFSILASLVVLAAPFFIKS